jgi:hypothetical protein
MTASTCALFDNRRELDNMERRQLFPDEAVMPRLSAILSQTWNFNTKARSHEVVPV